MAFRETIEAVLKVKDANRFKASMAGATRAVKKFGRGSEEAAAQTELLKSIERKLERQNLQLMASLELVAHSVNELGDEMEKTAAKSLIANTVMKKSGTNAVFLGKSWAFWKDRLSLTRSELMTTALTIGTYFSPAIIAMGSSFAYAALGGGGVAFGGLSSLALGFVTLYSVMKPVTDNIKKIMKAQDSYNVAVQQYGAASSQASAASAHLYGVMQTHGGAPMLKLVNNLRKFKTEWATLTKPGQASLVDVITGGMKTGRTLLPTLATGANSIAQQIQTSMKGAFKTLGGGEFRQMLRSLFETFDAAVGPGIKGAVNLIMVLGRIAVAAGPWVVKWAKSWERTTAAWRRSTKDTTKLDDFFRNSLDHFKAWWGLAKALGTTLRIIFGVSKDEGLKVVTVLTGIVTSFNDWLIKMRDTGQIKKFWKTWEDSIGTAFFIFTHPAEAFQKYFPGFLAAIDKYLPLILTHIANTFATSAPIIATTFIQAFLNSGGWARFFILSALLRKFGFFAALGAKIGDVFLGPFSKSFTRGFARQMGGAFAAEGAIGSAMTRWGTRAGGLFGKFFWAAFLLAVPIALALAADKIRNWVTNVANKMFHIKVDIEFPWEKRFWKGALGKLAKPFQDLLRNRKVAIDQPWKLFGGATGGIIPPGGSSIVGEAGPELATMGARGTQITPLNRNSRHTLPGMMDIPNLKDALSVTVHSYIMVDRREIARAVADQNSYDRARRGGRPRPAP